MIKQRPSRVTTITVVSAVVVAALLELLSQMSGDEEEAQEHLAGIPQDGTTLGAEDAPVTIYPYEDLQCPACASFTRETFPDLVTRYVEPGEVKVVSETLAFLGPDSVPAAKATLSAGEQDRYWEYSTLFFLNQGRENSGYVTDEFLTSIAEETQGMDIGQWNEARESGSVESELGAAQARAGNEVSEQHRPWSSAGLLLSALLKGEGGAFLGLFIALVSVLFSAYLTWLEHFVIHAICQWCVTSAILMLASLLLTVVRIRHSRVEPSKD